LNAGLQIFQQKNLRRRGREAIASDGERLTEGEPHSGHKNPAVRRDFLLRRNFSTLPLRGPLVFWFFLLLSLVV
jgi:hypothetical protein